MDKFLDVQRTNDKHPCVSCGKLIGAGYSHCEVCGGQTSSRSSSVSPDANGDIDSGLSLKIRRKYAKAKAVFEVGIWSAGSLDLLFSIMLGSMTDVRNSYDELKRDNRKLKYELDRMGLKYYSCFCPELSPDSHEFTKRDGSKGVTAGLLWHIHGFFKFEDYIGAADLHSVLSPLWGKIHGSQVVDVKVVHNEEKAIKYMVKDAVKMYLSDDYGNKRLFVSRGWFPPGYRDVNKVLNNWALKHQFDWENEEYSEPDQGYGQRLEFIPSVWEIKREYLKAWCKGEVLSLDFGDSKVYILGKEIQYVKRKVSVLR